MILRKAKAMAYRRCLLSKKLIIVKPSLSNILKSAKTCQKVCKCKNLQQQNNRNFVRIKCQSKKFWENLVYPQMGTDYGKVCPKTETHQAKSRFVSFFLLKFFILEKAIFTVFYQPQKDKETNGRTKKIGLKGRAKDGSFFMWEKRGKQICTKKHKLVSVCFFGAQGTSVVKINGITEEHRRKSVKPVDNIAKCFRYPLRHIREAARNPNRFAVDVGRIRPGKEAHNGGNFVNFTITP